MEFAVQNSAVLPQIETIEIDQKIDTLIAKHKNSRADLIKLSAECVALSTATESRAKGLASQGFFRRFWGEISGKNQRIQAANTQDLAMAQYAAQRMIVRLAEQNAMTMDVAVMIGARVNWIGNALLEAQNDLVQVWECINKIALDTRSRLSEINTRLDSLEKNQKLLFWKETIKDRTHHGIDFINLGKIHKLIVLAFEYHAITNFEWNEYVELIFLKTVLREIGIDPNEKIRISELYEGVISDGKIIDYFFDVETIKDRCLENPIHAPLIAGIIKLKNLQGKENYICKSIENILKKKISNWNSEELLLCLVSDYICQNTMIDSSYEIKVLDLIIELLVEIDVLRFSPIGGDSLLHILEEKEIEIRNLKKEINVKSSENNEIKIKMEAILDGSKHSLNDSKEEIISLKRKMIKEKVNNFIKLNWKVKDREIVEKGKLIAETINPMTGGKKIRAPERGRVFIVSDPLINGSEEFIVVLAHSSDSIDEIHEWVKQQ